MPRFNRDYRILIGPAGGKGVEILPPLHITFDIEKDTEEEPNTHVLRIWNLQKSTRELVEQPDGFVAIYAGYAEEDGPLLMAAGNVVFGYTYYDGADVITELNLLDGYVNIRDTAISLGYGPGAKASAIIASIAKQMGLALVMGDDVPDRTWQNGFSYYGAAYKALHKVVQGTGLEWSIQNGELQVIRKGGVTKRQALVLAADTGLFGFPERTREGSREKARVRDQKTGDNKNIVSAAQQRDGWRVTSLLLPQVNPGDLVKLESRSAEGLFRVESLRHTGDWGGSGDWTTELQLVARDAPTKKEMSDMVKKANKGVKKK